MERPEPASHTDTGPVLGYAYPTVGRRKRVKHAFAIAFAVIALPLGSLCVLNSVGRFVRSAEEPTTIDKRLFRQDAVKFFACGAVLIVAGVWYARVGFRGEVAGDQPGR